MAPATGRAARREFPEMWAKLTEREVARAVQFRRGNGTNKSESYDARGMKVGLRPAQSRYQRALDSSVNHGI
jgi:hypothetical protein